MFIVNCMPKKIYKKQKTIRSKTHGYEVLLESVESQVRLVAEGHDVLRRGIENTNQNINNLRHEVEQKFDMVFDELHLIRNDLKEKVSRDEFVVLEKRVAMIEKKMHS